MQQKNRIQYELSVDVTFCFWYSPKREGSSAMKFIKEDGTIEEGTPLTEHTAQLRDALEAYLHTVVCKNAYHSDYGNRKTCHTAANFLALTVNNNQDEPGDYAFAVEGENLRLNPPEPVKVPEPAPVVKDDDLAF